MPHLCRQRPGGRVRTLSVALVVALVLLGTPPWLVVAVSAPALLWDLRP